MVDECFLALSDSGSRGGLAGYVKSYPNLLLLRAFTALCHAGTAAGLLYHRIRVCWTDSPEVRSALERICSGPGSPEWRPLQEPLYPLLARQLIEVERRWLTGELTGLGLRVFPSAANYLLFQRGGGDGSERTASEGESSSAPVPTMWG